MPNGLAFLALFLFLPFGIGLFFVLRPPLAAVTVFLASMMLLPEKTVLDLPGLPGLGKEEVAAIAVFLGVLAKARRKLREARPLGGPDLWCLALMAGSLGTSFTNPDVLVYGPTVLPPLSAYEAVSVAFSDVLRYLLPFLIGRALFVSTRDLRTLFSALLLAAALYTPLIFMELMLSPQLHNWVYGFHQHDFIQTLRGGGYRPMVFMAHGLSLALMLAWAIIAGVTLFKVKKSAFGLPTTLLTPYVTLFLVLAKSLGALLYAVTAAPVVAFLKPRTQVRVALVLVAVVFSYPLLRATDVFPEKSLVQLASLEFRFNMESMLSQRAGERSLFGWGRFRRNMVFDEWGNERSVSDGFWVVLYGVRGGWGFVCFFAYLTSGLFLLRKRFRRLAGSEERILLSALAIIIGVCAVDLLPNGLFNTFSFFLAGALYGATRALSITSDNTVQERLQPLVANIDTDPPR
jgi:hypothetical protein